MTTALETISKRAEVYAQLRSVLAEKVNALNEGIAQLKADNLPGIKRALAKAADAESQLRTLVAENPQCFAKPRTQVFAGVKVGYQKGKGTVQVGDAATLVARIRKHLPDQADVLIRVKESPVKEALAQLSAAELKKIGAEIVDTGDQVVVKPVDSEVDKLVDALLKEATSDDEAAER